MNQLVTPELRTDPLLAFQLRAVRLQETYATKRFAYTQACLLEFARGQRELIQVRTRLLRLITQRSASPSPGWLDPA